MIAERFHFYKRDQAAGETAADFDVALRKLALHCKFEATLDDALRDRFVCGLRHESIQRRLLSETELTYTKAMDIAQAMEAADRNTRAFKPQQTQPILHMRNYHSPTQRERKACYRCGRTNHNEDNCKFKESTCHRCGKLGHIAPMCMAKSPNFGRESGADERTNSVRANHMEVVSDDGDSDSEAEEYHLY